MKKKILIISCIVSLLVFSFPLTIFAADGDPVRSHIVDVRDDTRYVSLYYQYKPSILTGVEWVFPPVNSTAFSKLTRGIYFTNSIPAEKYTYRRGYGIGFDNAVEGDGIGRTIDFLEGHTYTFNFSVDITHLGGSGNARIYFDSTSDFKVAVIASTPLVDDVSSQGSIVGGFEIPAKVTQSLNGNNIRLTFKCSYDCYYDYLNISDLLFTFKFNNAGGYSFVQNIAFYDFDIYATLLPEYEVIDGNVVKTKGQLIDNYHEFEKNLLDKITMPLKEYQKMFDVELFRELGNETKAFKQLLSNVLNLPYISAFVSFAVTLGLFGAILGIYFALRGKTK